MNNSWLDFGSDPDDDADTGISERNFYHCDVRTMLNCTQGKLCCLGGGVVSESFCFSFKMN